MSVICHCITGCSVASWLKTMVLFIHFIINKCIYFIYSQLCGEAVWGQLGGFSSGFVQIYSKWMRSSDNLIGAGWPKMASLPFWW